MKSPFFMYIIKISFPFPFFWCFIWKNHIRASCASSFPFTFIFSDLAVKHYLNISFHYLEGVAPLEPFSSPFPFLHPIGTRHDRSIIVVHIIIMILMYRFIIFQWDVFIIQFLEFVIIDKCVFA